MKNFEIMKKELINELTLKIKEMDEADFLDFTNVLLGEYILDKQKFRFNLSGRFDCKDCQRIYGSCNEKGTKPDECICKFKKYASMEK